MLFPFTPSGGEQFALTYSQRRGVCFHAVHFKSKRITHSMDFEVKKTEAFILKVNMKKAVHKFS